MPADPKLASIREQLPSVREYAYLNTGTYGPLTRAAAEAMRAWQEDELAFGRIAPGRGPPATAVKEAARASLARLIGAEPGSVALTGSTTDGMNIAVFGQRWRPGDEIVTTNVEHGGGLLPVRLAERRFGVVVREVDLTGECGDVAPLFAPLLNERTKLVALSNVSWSTGALYEVEALIRLCHERGVPIAIDGAQSAGAVPVDVAALGVDYYAFPGQKWLLGPSGTGGLYVRPERLDGLEPPWIGTGAVSTHQDLDHFRLWPDARRYEGATTMNLAALAGLTASLRWLLDEVDLDWALERNAALARLARERLGAIGAEVVTPPVHAPLVCFRVPGRSPDDVVAELAEHGVVARSVNDTGVVRFSTGFYVTEEEIERAVGLVEAAARRRAR